MAVLAWVGAVGPLACHASHPREPEAQVLAEDAMADASASIENAPNVSDAAAAASASASASASPSLDDDSGIPFRPIPAGAAPVAGLPGCVLDDRATLSCDSLFSWHLRDCYAPDLTFPGKVLMVCAEDGKADDRATSDLGNSGCMFARPRVVIAPDPTSAFRVVALTSRAEVAAYVGLETAAAALSFALLVNPHSHIVRDGFRSTASGKGPFSVSLVTYEVCGCTHPTERVSLSVTKLGAIVEKKRTVLKSTSGLCVD